MIRVIVSLSGRVIQDYTFTQQRVKIGRTPENDIQLDNPLLSRCHAELAAHEGGWQLTDLGSQNGTYVNGRQATRVSLNDGDCVGLGKFVLSVRFEVGADAGRGETGWPAADDLVGYVTAGRSLSLPQGSARLPQRFVEALQAPLGHLRVRKGPPEGVFTLRRDCFHVGTTASCELRVLGLWPSRMAVIVRGLSGYGLVSLVRRGVYRNGKPVRLRCALEDGDRLEFGSVLAAFHAGMA